MFHMPIVFGASYSGIQEVQLTNPNTKFEDAKFIPTIE